MVCGENNENNSELVWKERERERVERDSSRVGEYV